MNNQRKNAFDQGDQKFFIFFLSFLGDKRNDKNICLYIPAETCEGNLNPYLIAFGILMRYKCTQKIVFQILKILSHHSKFETS